jgi:hypothetical protein
LIEYAQVAYPDASLAQIFSLSVRVWLATKPLLIKSPGGPIFESTEISVAAVRIGALSKVEQISAKKVSPSMYSMFIVNCVCQPRLETASSNLKYAALAAMMTIGPNAGYVATIFPNVPANSLAGSMCWPREIVSHTCLRIYCFLISPRRTVILIVSITNHKYSFD